MTGRLIDVLVVDDDYRVAATHAAFVERVPGYRTVGRAHTAAQANELIASARPDLVLLDLYLPDGDGLEVARTILNQPDPPAIMVISSARDITHVRQAMQLGVTQYLVKPFAFAALAERLIAFARLHQRLAALGPDPDQSDVDELFTMYRAGVPTRVRADRGHSAPTLELVRDTVAHAASPMSATEVSTAIGVSRATAQRYLTYLEQHGVVKLELRYGSTGRPEHRYALVPQ